MIVQGLVLGQPFLGKIRSARDFRREFYLHVNGLNVGAQGFDAAMFTALEHFCDVNNNQHFFENGWNADVLLGSLVEFFTLGQS